VSDLAARAGELRAKRIPFVSATVVRAERPTSAKPGDSALVLSDGSIEGFVGGDCAETNVVAQALATLETGEPVLLRITPQAPEPPAASEEPPLRGSVTVHNPCLSGGTLEIFLEPARPPPLLVVHGKSPMARAVADLARHMGYDVHDALEAARVSIPSDASAVVVASHGRGEAEVLKAALDTGVPYVGLVASRKRGAPVLASLGATAEQVHTPAGIDIGARTPEEIALSILAEIVSLRLPAPKRGKGTVAPLPSATVDPVCGMTVAAVDASLHVDHEGTLYWFCGSGCLQAFVADPGSFVGR
jgi:xanthine dehydrogenase accessory factor